MKNCENCKYLYHKCVRKEWSTAWFKPYCTLHKEILPGDEFVNLNEPIKVQSDSTCNNWKFDTSIIFDCILSLVLGGGILMFFICLFMGWY